MGRARRQQRKRARRFGKRVTFRKFYNWFKKCLTREIKHKLRMIPSKRQLRRFSLTQTIGRQFRLNYERAADLEVEKAIRGS